VYAHAYGLVAVGDAAGVLSVWAVATGQLVRCVRDAHGGAPITSLSTDAPGRRLISGAHDGSVCTWSLATGCELSCRLAPHDVGDGLGTELTTLIHLSVARGAISYVLGSGWGRRVVLWRDEVAPQGVCAEPGGGPECVWASPPSHTDDVLCMAHHAPSTLATAPSTLATGTADGVVALWELDTNALSQHGGMGRPVQALDKGGTASLNAMRVKRTLRVPPAASVPGASFAAAVCSSPPIALNADLVDASAVECVCWLPSIAPPLVPLVAATTDGRLLVWGAVTRLQPGQPAIIDLHESLGHCDEDALVALVTDELNTILVSADGGGTIKVWSLTKLAAHLERSYQCSVLRAGGTPPSPAKGGGSHAEATGSTLPMASLGEALAFWRVRDGGLVAMELVPSRSQSGSPLGPSRSQSGSPLGPSRSQSGSPLILTGAADGTTCLFTLSGALVGTFGANAIGWRLDDPNTYACRTAQSPRPFWQRRQKHLEDAKLSKRAQRLWGSARVLAPPLWGSARVLAPPLWGSARVLAPPLWGSARVLAPPLWGSARVLAPPPASDEDVMASATALAVATALEAADAPTTTRAAGLHHNSTARAAAAAAARAAALVAVAAPAAVSEAAATAAAVQRASSVASSVANPSPPPFRSGVRFVKGPSAAGGVPTRRADKSSTWENALHAQSALSGGDLAAAQAAAAQAAAAAHRQHVLRAKGFEVQRPPQSTNEIHTFLKGKSGAQLGASYEGGVGPTVGASYTAARPPPLDPNRVADASISLERDLERVLHSTAVVGGYHSGPAMRRTRYGGRPAARGETPSIGPWRQVLTKQWEAPPDNPRPASVGELRQAVASAVPVPEYASWAFGSTGRSKYGVGIAAESEPQRRPKDVAWGLAVSNTHEGRVAASDS
jgi:hypothetical protein